MSGTDTNLAVAEAEQVSERFVLFRLGVPDGRLEAALLGHGRDDVGRGIRVDVLSMMFEVRVAEDKFLHWQAGAHLEKNLENARKWDVVGIWG